MNNKEDSEEASYGDPEFSPTKKRHKVSRWCALVDTLNHEGIRRRLYHLYKANEKVTVSKLLLTRLRVTVVNL